MKNHIASPYLLVKSVKSVKSRCFYNIQCMLNIIYIYMYIYICIYIYIHHIYIYIYVLYTNIYIYMYESHSIHILGYPKVLLRLSDWARQAQAMPPWRGTDPRSRWEVLDTLTAVALEQLVGGCLGWFFLINGV